jgi:hypothetical protein
MPIFVRPCDWKGAPFGKLQGVPRDIESIYDFPTPDHGFAEAAKAKKRREQDARTIRTSADDEDDIAVIAAAVAAFEAERLRTC